MEKQSKIKNTSQKHTLFKESINLNNYQKQPQTLKKSKKDNRLKTQMCQESESFDVKRHFKYLKQNYACYQELNYQDQNTIKNTYLSRDTIVVSRKQRKSCPLIQQLQRQPSIRKCDFKVKCQQPDQRKSTGTYWAIKEVSTKMKNWIK